MGFVRKVDNVMSAVDEALSTVSVSSQACADQTGD